MSDFGCRISGEVRTVASFCRRPQIPENCQSAAALAAERKSPEIRNPKSDIQSFYDSAPSKMEKIPESSDGRLVSVWRPPKRLAMLAKLLPRAVLETTALPSKRAFCRESESVGSN